MQEPVRNLHRQRGAGAPAFEAMSRALGQGRVTEVVVPRLEHLGHVPGFGPCDVRLLARYLHATVVAVGVVKLME